MTGVEVPLWLLTAALGGGAGLTMGRRAGERQERERRRQMESKRSQ